jgi:hypothetical protein
MHPDKVSTAASVSAKRVVRDEEETVSGMGRSPAEAIMDVLAMFTLRCPHRQNDEMQQKRGV